MVDKGIYKEIVAKKAKGIKSLAILIDPDHVKLSQVEQLIKTAIDSKVDYFLFGGSLIVNDMLDSLLIRIKSLCDIPLVLFPGNSFQLSYKADALMFLSLISVRNPDLLIGKHVITAPFLKLSPLEIISTGYMLIDGGVATSVQYMSNTLPIPASKVDIAMSTALAGEYLGLKMIYMDAGSGAINAINTEMIEGVSCAISVPLIVGGGIRTPEQVSSNIGAGADIIVVGNAVEKDPYLISELAAAAHSN